MSRNRLANKIKIQILDHEDNRWIEFIASQPEANIFHHPAWINLLSKCYGYRPFVVAALDTEDKIRAGLPLVQVNSILTGKRWVSLPFTDYCPPLYQDEDLLTDLENWFAEALTEKRIPRIEIRGQLQDREGINHQSDFVIHTIQLNKDPDRVAKKFKRSHRQNINTARKRGVQIKHGNQVEHLRLYYQLQLETRHRQGLPVQPWAFFKCLASTCFDKQMGFVKLAYKEQECIAGVVYLYWQNYMIAKYAASKDAYWQLRPNNLLFWAGIKWGCENDISIFDFGRSETSNSGLRRYKRGWGADEQPIVYSILSKKPVQSKNSKALNLLQPIFQKSPRWVCKLTGELLYKHYG